MRSKELGLSFDSFMDRQKSGLTFNSLSPSIACDIDEVNLDAATKHAEQLYDYAKKHGWNSPVPPKKFFELGGSHASYGDIDEYWDRNEFMINDPEFNSNLEPIPDAVESLNFLAPHLLLYLTTRPESLISLTEEELEKNGFPKREVVARPAAISIKNTTPWKLDILTQLAKEKSMVMIDDSYSLHEAILRAQNPNISSILFKGLITPEHPFSMDWREIVELPCWNQTLDSLNFSISCSLVK